MGFPKTLNFFWEHHRALKYVRLAKAFVSSLHVISFFFTNCPHVCLKKKKKKHAHTGIRGWWARCLMFGFGRRACQRHKPGSLWRSSGPYFKFLPSFLSFISLALHCMTFFFQTKRKQKQICLCYSCRIVFFVCFFSPQKTICAFNVVLSRTWFQLFVCLFSTSINDHLQLWQLTCSHTNIFFRFLSVEFILYINLSSHLHVPTIFTLCSYLVALEISRLLKP